MGSPTPPIPDLSLTPLFSQAGQSYSQKKLHEARQHLALFFDYVEGHGLISPDVHMDLTSFSFAPASTAVSETEARGTVISSKLAKFVNGRGFDEGTPEDSVHGTFAVYRIRSNFCLLTQPDDGELSCCVHRWGAGS